MTDTKLLTKSNLDMLLRVVDLRREDALQYKQTVLAAQWGKVRKFLEAYYDADGWNRCRALALAQRCNEIGMDLDLDPLRDQDEIRPWFDAYDLILDLVSIAEKIHSPTMRALLDHYAEVMDRD
ncbi:hypothetical protein GP475_09625 [Corynebacterium poyangense]|uniref:Uncharacterized protein n=1 Tax=Corynebacterium poyangense TaxID=2684405 RepID=A0A7H0SQP4_9CORY|nr:hypothetical protein [Corynebacterium poyangense]QNQ90869.1 hypothetical protein GP475_09625 [Corynebacterium poyangense]